MIKKMVKILSLFFCIFINILLDMNVNRYILLLEKCFNTKLDIQNYYILIYAIIALITCLLYLSIYFLITRREPKNKGLKLKTESGVHGTADWMSDEEIKDTFEFNSHKGILLGEKDGKAVTLNSPIYNRNVCVVGSSGSMKSIGYLLPNLFQSIYEGNSIVITDTKGGDLYKKSYNVLKENDYTIRVFNLVNMEYSDSWNVLAEIEDLDDAQGCADTIILNTQLHSKTDDFWPRAEENLLKALILYYMREESLIEEKTLTKVYRTIASGDIKDLAEKFDKIDNEEAAKQSYNIFASGSDTIKASVITGLGTRLQAFQNKMVQKLTNTNEIDLELPAKEKCAYFLILSDMESTYSFLSSLFFTFFFKKLCKYADSRPNRKM